MKVHTQNNNHKKLKFFICAAAVIGVSIFVIIGEPQCLVYCDNKHEHNSVECRLTQPSDRNIFLLWIRLVCTLQPQSSGWFPVQGTAGSWGIQVMLLYLAPPRPSPSSLPSPSTKAG